MSYRFHYVFCATPFEAEAELKAFHQAIATFNETEAMPNGYLFAALVIVPALADKRPFQGAISENIRMSRYYIQVIEDSWGPPQRDFERDWALAKNCQADASMPMRETILLFKSPLLPHKVDPAIVELKRASLSGEGPHASPHASFDNVDQLQTILRTLFSGWLTTVLAEANLEQCPS
jgi:hypothetical protein